MSNVKKETIMKRVLFVLALVVVGAVTLTVGRRSVSAPVPTCSVCYAE